MKGILSLTIILLISLLYLPASAENGELTPENTVILSNETDESFCRDFSVLLKRVRPEWVILDSAVIPESARDKNLIIIGEVDAEYTGAVIKEFLTQEEEEYIRDGHYSVLEKESPWADDKIIYVCMGSDRLLTKKAAEETIASLDGEWTYPPFPSAPYEEAREYIAQIQYIPEDDELPKEALRMEIDPKSPRSISREEASEDVEYLFCLFSHGYCGYGYFMTKGDFDEAKKSILRELEMKSMWSPDDFSQLIYDNLTFIHDCHFHVGDYQYCSHEDFWYDTQLELSKTGGEYYFTSDNTYKVVSINGEDPGEFMFPSLNAQGDPMYRLGVLSRSPPEPLVLTAHYNHEQHQFTIQLNRSDFEYFLKDIVREDTIGGIPVIRIRSFSDAAAYTEYIDQFFETAQKYKGESCLIIDIRGNIGGNALWAKTWVTRFTGWEPYDMYYYTEFISKTTAMGRVNLMEYLLNLFPDTYIYETEMDRFRAQTDAFEKQYTVPHWTGPFSPGDQVIPNDTTLIVVTNGKTGSAAELFINYLSQMESVVFVGENSAGCLTFGLANFHRLPHSKLLVQLPMSLSIPLDLEFKEEKGFFPHLWIPAEDALNYAVAAVRKGTITTVQPLPEEVLQEEFIPEEFMQKEPSKRNDMSELFIATLSVAVLGMIPALLNRKRNKLFFFILGIIWAAVGIIILYRVSPMGYVFFIIGVTYFVIGVYKWKRTAPDTNPRR